MLFGEEERGVPKFIGTCDILKLHEKLKPKELPQSILLPEIYAGFRPLLLDFISKILKKNLNNFNEAEYFELLPNQNGNLLIEDFKLAAEFAQKTAFSEYKFIIIHNACALSLSVANALLKILEEPTNNTFFLLLYSNKQNVLPTIRSRCILINFYNSVKNFNFLYENFIKIPAKKEEIEDFTGRNLNLLTIFANNESFKIIEELKLLTKKGFNYTKFKKFYSANSTKQNFREIIFLFLEKTLGRAIKQQPNKSLLNLYFFFIFQKKYVKLYNTNLEAFLYYIIYTICEIS